MSRALNNSFTFPRTKTPLRPLLRMTKAFSFSLGTVLKILAWLAAVLLLAAGAAMRLDVLPAVPLIEWDTRGWLEPALRWAGGGEFRENAEREWLYAAFLAGCLKCFGSFSSVVWVQWGAGLAGGAMLFLTWQTWTSLLPRRLPIQIVATAAGLFVLAAYVLNPNLVAFEMSLRPEALLGVVVIAVYLCATNFVKFRWFAPDNRLVLAWGVPIPALAIAVGILKPSWALALPWMMLPLLISIPGSRSGMGPRALPLALGAVLAFALLILPEKMFFKKGPEARVVLPMTLLTIHADAVISSSRRLLSDPSLSEERRAVLEQALPVLESDFAKSKEVPLYYKKLGFDPDYIMYRARIFPYLESQHGFSKAGLAAFCNQAYRDAWRHAPGMMLSKVFSQLGYIAFPDARTYTKREVKLQPLIRHSNEISAAELDDSFGSRIREIYAVHRVRSIEAENPEREIRGSKKLDRWLKSWVPPALPVAILALGLAALVFVFRFLAPLRCAALLCLLYFAIPAGNALTIALVHALDNDRYRMSYGMILLFAIISTLVLALSAAWETGFYFWRKRYDIA